MRYVRLLKDYFLSYSIDKKLAVALAMVLLPHALD